MINELLLESVLYAIVHLIFWGILLPLSFILATPVILVRAALEPTRFLSCLGRDYRALLEWWMDHRPFQD